MWKVWRVVRESGSLLKVWQHYCLVCVFCTSSLLLLSVSCVSCFCYCLSFFQHCNPLFEFCCGEILSVDSVFQYFVFWVLSDI